MFNPLLITKKQKNNILLNYLGKSRLNGLFIYEIIFDKCNRNKSIKKQINCNNTEIITNPMLWELHLTPSSYIHSIKIYDPYGYKDYYHNFKN